MKSPIPVIALLAATAAAKTDYDGCTSFTSMVTVRTEIGYGNTYATVIWYDPSNLELCKGVDCGGGRAPPKTVPGCPAYSGTETVEPTFLSEDPANPKPTSTEEAAETKSTEVVEEEEETKGADDSDDAAAGSTVKTTAPPAKTTSSPAETTATPTPSSSGDEQETPGATSGEEEEGSATSTDGEAGASLPTAALNVVAGVAAIVALL
ncbi:hypothetical protein ACRE_035550 [Hapsidospora chrysogenum ATCC 11550]|uniref:Uncharacterized protein n=1 Tax=Hapsidospora chrysogenum (strain ATCC 11550 / CBS 779.69 / DSM 880 / IAM 14645 / JCM 23072 / IMI 49137) TaxID=857340 RepID=A0A086T8I6_HAPC1|nr:hypothetical protein ACRE_035550 [Hapsidospora chrysogenum ATCC 11550]